MSKDRINTSELAAMLATHLSVAVKDAEAFMLALIEVMEEQLLANDVVKMKGLGSFKLQWNEPRKSVDVNTSEDIIIDGYYKISFTPEPELKELVNAPYAHLQPVVLGAPEPEEMDDEEVEVVEEEIMKEMEDPRKLADAMRTITEQAIEIKDILSEMNLIGGVRKPLNHPVLIDEEIPAKMQPESVDADNTIAEATTIVSPDKPVQDKPENKSRRPGPFVPVGPPPVVDADDENEEDEDEEEEFILPFTAQREPELDDEEIIPVEVERAHHQPVKVVPEVVVQAPVVTPPLPKPQKTRNYSWLMLLLGLILGGAGVYVLDSMGLIPGFKWPVKQPEAINMIEVPQDSLVAEDAPMPHDTLPADSLANTAALEVAEPVDTLQQLFDTPRKYTEYIASETVRDGSRITRISERHYGAKEFWVYIYEANRNLLKHPDDIATGMVLKIPLVDARLIDKNNPRCIEYALHLHDEYIKK
jgi:nucleoid DNA-binding protein